MRPSSGELPTCPPRWYKGLGAGHRVERMLEILDAGDPCPVSEGPGMKKPTANRLQTTG